MSVTPTHIVLTCHYCGSVEFPRHPDLATVDDAIKRELLAVHLQTASHKGMVILADWIDYHIADVGPLPPPLGGSPA
jgi:hypothetical protein